MKLADRMAVTDEYNRRAREEIERAGQSSFSCDPIAVWGVTAEEIDQFVVAGEARYRRLRPWRYRERDEALRSVLAWKCRRAAIHGCEVLWR